MKTTLFLPVHNEIEGLRLILPRINRDWVDEILIVDGNSSDGTPEFCEKMGYRVIRQKSTGLIGAYWECLEVAAGDVIIPFSPDNNSIPEIIPELVARMREGYDLVIVSRYCAGAKSADDDVVTAFGNWAFTRIVNILFRAKYTDVLVMFRAFRKDLIKRLQIDSTEYRPVLEIILCIRCAVQGLRVGEIPGDEPPRVGGVRKMRVIYNGSCLLWIIMKEFFKPCHK